MAVRDINVLKLLGFIQVISQARLCVLHWIDLHLLSCREFGASHWSEGAKDRGGVMAEPSGIESQG